MSEENLINKELFDSFKDFITPLVTKEIEIHSYCILFNGKRYKTSKGKSVWATKGAAKSAFTLHIKYVFKKYVTNHLISKLALDRFEVYKYPGYYSCYKTFLKYLEDNGTLEIIEMKL